MMERKAKRLDKGSVKMIMSGGRAAGAKKEAMHFCLSYSYQLVEVTLDGVIKFHFMFLASLAVPYSSIQMTSDPKRLYALGQ